VRHLKTLHATLKTCRPQARAGLAGSELANGTDAPHTTHTRAHTHSTHTQTHALNRTHARAHAHAYAYKQKVDMQEVSQTCKVLCSMQHIRPDKEIKRLTKLLWWGIVDVPNL
jgi:hypothetical protein